MSENPFYCRFCKKAENQSHFEYFVKSNGQNYKKCKIKLEIEKQKRKSKKYCKSCKKRMPLEHFDIHMAKSGKIMLVCSITYKKNGYKLPGSKKGKYQPRLKSLNYERNSKEYKRDRFLEKRYGINLEQYNSILKEQGNCCAICKKSKDEFDKSLCVDHCHQTGQIRGILCLKCNKALGHFKDNIDNLKFALEYIKFYEETVLYLS